MSLTVPSRREAWQRLRAAAPPDWVLEHVLLVEGLAAAMVARARERGLEVDAARVHAGAILHDLGRSITQDPRHAHLGAELLRAAGDTDDAVIAIVERHTGAGLEPDDAERVGIPRADYTPVTLEEKIVAHADNLWSGSKRLRLADIEQKYGARGLPHAWQKIRRLHDELCARLDCDVETLAPVALPRPDA
jgi:uncharacterized protein (TIGR00295 family)